MKTLAISLFCLTAFFANAQFTLGIKAGYNNASPHYIKSYYDQLSGGNGWQASLYLQHNIHKWFVYSGAGVTANNFQRYSPNSFFNSYSSIYSPVYLNIPAGAGYTITLPKSFAVKLYAGIYGQAGITGKVKAITRSSCDLVPCPESFPLNITDEHHIKFKSTSGDLKPISGGIQTGIGLQAFKAFELQFMYNAGLLNIIPNDYNYKIGLSSFFIDARFNIKTFKR